MSVSLRDVSGIGPKTEEFLNSHDIKTAEQLVQGGRQILEKAPGINLSRAAYILESANQLLEVHSQSVNIESNKYLDSNKEQKKDNKKNTQKTSTRELWVTVLVVFILGMIAGTYSDPWEPGEFILVWIAPIFLWPIAALFTHEYSLGNGIFIFFLGLFVYQSISGDAEWRNRPFDYVTTEFYYDITLSLNPPKQPEKMQKEFEDEILKDI